MPDVRLRRSRGPTRLRRWRWWWVAACAFACVAGILALSLQPLSFTVALATPKEEQDAQRIITKASAPCCGGVIPRANWLWYPQEAIRSDLAAAFPHYAAFSFEQVGWGAVRITGTLRAPFARWCRGEWHQIADLPEPKRLATELPVRDCPAAVDAAGEVFRPPLDAAILTLPVRQWISVQEGIPARVLQQGEEAEGFTLLQALIRWLEAHQVPVVRIEENPIGIRIVLRSGAILILASTRQAEDIPTSLEAMLQQGAFLQGEEAPRTLQEALAIVRYIDYRDFPRVYIGQR